MTLLDTSNNGKSKDHANNGKQASWLGAWAQPHYILLFVIFVQGWFIVFMGFEGPHHHDHRAKVSVHRSHKQFRSHSKRHWNKNKDKNSQKNVVQSEEEGGEEEEEQADEEGSSSSQQQQQRRSSSTNKQPPVTRKPKPPKATIPPQYKSAIQSRGWQVNSKKFPGALHFHFEQERLEPFFRTKQVVTPELLQQQAAQDALDAAKKMVRKNQELKPCHYYAVNDNPDDPAKVTRLVNQLCFKGGKKSKGIIVYNSQPFERIWCGKVIQPNGIVHVKKLCEHANTEPPRLLLPDSDKMLSTIRRDLMKLPRIIFLRKDSYGSLETVKDCNVPCKVSMDTCTDEKSGKQVKGEVCLPEISDWTVEGTDFQFRFSKLDPRNNPQEVGISRKAYRENQYYATRSFQSEIPLSSFDWDRYGEMKNAPRTDFKKSGKRGMAFFHLEPCSGEIRPGVWAGKVQEAFKGSIDYYGPCDFGNANLKPTMTKLDLNKYSDRQMLMSQYMFTFVIGHSQSPDIISELVWDALTAGSIPVYFGAPNIREHVPKNSVIVGGEYSSQKDLAEYLDKIRKSKDVWNNLHAWRDDEEGMKVLDDKYGFLKEKSSSAYCRMCRWALAAKYSLGWNPKTQQLEKPMLDRKFCVSPKDELKTPVEELWLSDMGMEVPRGRRFCDKVSFVEQTISFDGVDITRRATSHDNGIVDIAITDIKSLRKALKVVLRLDFRSIDNDHGAHLPQPHQLMADSSGDKPASNHIPLCSSIAIQDDKTRATIITDWVTELRTPKQSGFVDILVKDLTKADGPEIFPDKTSEDLVVDKVPRLMKDEILRIRIILEDVNRLRDASTEYNMSPYARQMIADFLDPMMFFMIK